MPVPVVNNKRSLFLSFFWGGGGKGVVWCNIIPLYFFLIRNFNRGLYGTNSQQRSPATFTPRSRQFSCCKMFSCLRKDSFTSTFFKRDVLDVRRKAASLRLRVCYRSVTRRVCYVEAFAILRHYAVYFGIWLLTGTTVCNIQSITRATNRPTITTIRAQPLFRVQLLKYFLFCR
jgi:hypothetical protein